MSARNRAEQRRATVRAQLEADVERARVVEEFAASLVEVRVVPVRARFERPTTKARRLAREAR